MGGENAAFGSEQGVRMSLQWPRLRDRVTPLVRLDGTVQFGLIPGHGLRLGGLTEGEVDWLRSLDGAADPLVRGRRAGLDPRRLGEVLTALERAGLLHTGGDGFDPAGGRAAASARIWIEGTGVAGGPLQELLHRAGISDVARLPRHGPLPRYRRVPDLVILLTQGPALSPDAVRWRQRRVPHLPLAHLVGGAVIGPLVPAVGGPCLRCIDLARADRDPSWSTIAAQSRIGATPALAEHVGDDAEASIAAGMVARLVLSFVAGAAIPPGLTLEVGSPWPAVRQYQWDRHPQCPSCSTIDDSRMTMGA